MEGPALDQYVDFEYDAPQFYDFEQETSLGAPADEWFDTAPDGPGSKPADRMPRTEPVQTEEKENKPGPKSATKANIVTSWGTAQGNGAAGTKRHLEQGHTSGELPAHHHGVTKARRISKDQLGPRTEAPVTRSMSRLRAMTPVPEKSASCRSAEVNFKPALEGPRKGCVSAPRERMPRPAADHRLKQVLHPKVTRPACSTKPLTLPQDMELNTSRRLRSAVKEEQTVERSPFKSLAEKVKEFQSKTPARFRSKVTKPPPSKLVLGITEAKEPVLWTSTRARPSYCKKRDEELMEEDEQEMQKAFQAKPVDPTILNSSGQLGVPRVEKKGLTSPHPFNLRSDVRAQKRKSVAVGMQPADGPTRGLRSSHLNRSILDGPTFQPVKEATQLTVPKSPFLRTKQRHHEDHQVPHEEPKVEFHARPMPKYRKSLALPAPHKDPTQPKPFQLATEQRGQQYQAELQQRLAEEERAAKLAAQVVAKPLPHSIDVPAVPPKPEPKTLTIPDPFKLKSEVRHQEYVEHWQEELTLEEQQAQAAAEVKAHPMWAGKPYTVHGSDRPLTVPEGLPLATDHRAAERAAFDEAMAQKEREMQGAKERARREHQEQEEKEAKEYRKRLRFQAREMPNFDQPFYTMPSKRPLTQPKTPNFASKKLKQSKDA